MGQRKVKFNFRITSESKRERFLIAFIPTVIFFIEGEFYDIHILILWFDIEFSWCVEPRQVN